MAALSRAVNFTVGGRAGGVFPGLWSGKKEGTDLHCQERVWQSWGGFRVQVKTRVKLKRKVWAESCEVTGEGKCELLGRGPLGFFSV